MTTTWAAWGAALALALAPGGVLAGEVRVAAGADVASAPNAGQAAFRDIFREMIETDTSPSTGSCTALAQKIAQRFRTAGFSEDQITLFRNEALPLDGGLIVTLPGTSAKSKPILLMGHIDVVNSKPVHWKTDPYKFVEKDGYFFGRGTADMKALDAIWVDSLLRFRSEGFKPRRTIKLVLTCGGEAGSRFNGVEWLVRNRPELLTSEFALNEGGGGMTNEKGNVIEQSLSVGEMTMANFDIEAFSEGGPAALPTDDNAIYEISDAVQKVRALKFPLHFNDTTRAYFTEVGMARRDALGDAMVRLAANPADSAAEAVVAKDRTYNALMRTTCVATMMLGGYVITSLPQTAKVTVSCYVVPGENAETTRDALVKAIGKPDMIISQLGGKRPQALAPSLDPRVIKPAEKLAAQYFPGVRFVPGIRTNSTDAVYLASLGIPVYGIPGLYTEPDGNSAHGHDERMSVRSAYIARDFVHDLVKVYATKD